MLLSLNIDTILWVLKTRNLLRIQFTNPFFPPATNNAVAVAPSVNAQKILCITGGSGTPNKIKQYSECPKSELVETGHLSPVFRRCLKSGC